MATYTGDPTATQAPSPPPTPGAAPVANLVVDGTAINAASVNQQTKVEADYTAWLMSPRAKSSDFFHEIVKWMNARLQARFGIDHLGFPAGQIIQWDEDWSYAALVAASLSANGTFGRWKFSVTNLASCAPGADFSGGGALNNLFMEMASGNGSGSPGLGTIEGCLPAFPVSVTGGPADTDIACPFQWDAYAPSTTNAANTEVSMGLAFGGPQPGSGKFSTATPEGAAFVKRAGDTNWQTYTKLAAGGATYTDTGVAFSTTLHRFRIERVGSGAADDSTSRVFFIIDGADVSSGGVAIFPRQPTPFFQLNSATGLSRFRIGPAALRANHWANAFL